MVELLKKIIHKSLGNYVVFKSLMRNVGLYLEDGEKGGAFIDKFHRIKEKSN
jgi:hypothetical protein